MPPEGVALTDYGLLGLILSLSLGVILYLWRQLMAALKEFTNYLKERSQLDHVADVARSEATTKLTSTLEHMELSAGKREERAEERHREVMGAIRDVWKGP